MLFRSRHKPTALAQLRRFVWPRSGWARAASYVGHRVARLPGSTHSIAVGFACGAAISFTPFLGFHFALAALLAWLIGGNIIASAIGTVVGNPWTFPFIWWWTFRLGGMILGLGPSHEFSQEITMQYIFSEAERVFLPMTVGGVPTAVAAWFAFYFPSRYIVEGYRRAYAKRRSRRAARQSGTVG